MTVLDCSCRQRNYCLNGCINYTTHSTTSTCQSGCTSEHAHASQDTIVVISQNGDNPSPDPNPVPVNPDDVPLGGLLGGGSSTYHLTYLPLNTVNRT